MNIRDSLISAAAAACPIGRITCDKAAAAFLRKQNPDGGFRGKGVQSDLYYTGFALMSLLALGRPADRQRLHGYLEQFAVGQGLDLAHLAALIRCHRLLNTLVASFLELYARQLETFRCKDGAYHHLCTGEEGSAYGCFLALAAYEDLGMAIPDLDAIILCLHNLKAEGGYYNESMLPVVSVPATAAAITTLVAVGQLPDSGAADWLLKSRDIHGGFKVMPAAPVADLLSTAVALHALRTAGADIDPICPIDINFVTGLWDDDIGFRQNIIDPISDCEYCFYGLLALGHLQ
jgi:prenyltransferase beta subunit